MLNSVSIVCVTTRPDLLKLTLPELVAQSRTLTDRHVQLLVVNDGYSCNETLELTNSLGCRYLFTGHRNQSELVLRGLGFALNCGVKNVDGDLLVITQADILPSKNALKSIVDLTSSNYEHGHSRIATLRQIYDDDGSIVSSTDPTQRTVLINKLRASRPKPSPFRSHPDMPFFLCLPRRSYVDIGGCDEDFVGYASEDNDLMNRLVASGCTYVKTDQTAVHLFHGRPDHNKILASTKFRYNRQLMNERSGQLVRNAGREWGRVVQPDQPISERPLHLVIWATSRCNLKCPLCNQSTARKIDPSYSMSIEDVRHLISSSKERGIKYKTIEFTGGEISLWPNFEQALREISESGITEELSFITNGNDAERVAGIAYRYCPSYCVSLQQATPEQVNIHRQYGVRVFWITGPHLPSPEEPVQGSLLAQCHTQVDRWGFPANQLLYYDKNVYRCCIANMHFTLFVDGLEKGYCVPFDSDFASWARQKTSEWPLCQICLCNNKVYNRMKVI